MPLPLPSFRYQPASGIRPEYDLSRFCPARCQLLQRWNMPQGFQDIKSDSVYYLIDTGMDYCRIIAQRRHRFFGHINPSEYPVTCSDAYSWPPRAYLLSYRSTSGCENPDRLRPRRFGPPSPSMSLHWMRQRSRPRKGHTKKRLGWRPAQVGQYQLRCFQFSPLFLGRAARF